MIVHHPSCFGCGPDNPFGLKLDVSVREDGSVAGSCLVERDHMGPPGVAHGGIVATALDEVMSLLIHARGVHALTTGLEIRLRAPAPIEGPLDLEARVEGEEGRRLNLTAVASSGGTEVATARGVFVKVER